MGTTMCTCTFQQPAMRTTQPAEQTRARGRRHRGRPRQFSTASQFNESDHGSDASTITSVRSRSSYIVATRHGQTVTIRASRAPSTARNPLAPGETRSNMDGSTASEDSASPFPIGVRASRAHRTLRSSSSSGTVLGSTDVDDVFHEETEDEPLPTAAFHALQLPEHLWATLEQRLS